LPQSLRPERSHREYQKKAGIWLRENIPPDAIIMGNGPIEIFYAGREFVLMPPLGGNPAKSYAEIIHFAKEKRVRYILFNTNSVERNTDFLDSIRPTDLREFQTFKGKDNLIRIYEVIY
jgi:hypothetical protein